MIAEKDMDDEDIVEQMERERYNSNINHQKVDTLSDDFDQFFDSFIYDNLNSKKR